MSGEGFSDFPRRAHRLVDETVCGVVADEELLLYFSAYGNEGFLLTNKALYSSNKLLGRVPYYAIDFVVGDMKNCSIKILRQELPMKHVSDERFKTLQYLFELISIIQKVTPLQS